MIDYNQIQGVHLEISSRCNAVCPDCPRNFRGVDVIDNYPVCDLRLDQIKKIFSVEFLQQLNNILINGNYGDFVTARDALRIVEYFYQINPNLLIEVSTNGSAQPKIWTELGKTPIRIGFRIDGLKDTNHLYRQNTDFDLIISNARQFIQAGGHAIWTMIVFDHNKHQIEDEGVRNVFPVFTPDRRLSHIVGNYKGSTDFDSLWKQHTERNAWDNLEYATESYPIKCKAVESKSIYITSNGEVYPCCWLGFSPLTDNTKLVNLQMQDFIKENNALDYSVEHAISWFHQVEASWSKSSVAAGKLVACNDTCGVR